MNSIEIKAPKVCPTNLELYGMDKKFLEQANIDRFIRDQELKTAPNIIKLKFN